MAGHYLKIAWRNILRNKLYAALNILGLSLGLCCCIVIFQVVSYEFSFDRFHPGAKNIYRVGADITDVTGDKLKFIRLPAGLSAATRNSITGIESIAAVIPYNANITILPGNQFKSRDGAFPFITTVIVEPDYFDIFKYKWIAGDVTALSEPSRVVLTEARAKEYFGNVSVENIIGKQVVYQDSLVVTVGGVIKQWDKPTDLGYTDFISFATIHQSFLRNTIKFDSWKQPDLSTWIYTRISKQSRTSISQQLAEIARNNADTRTKMTLWLEPLSSIHFNPGIIENPIRTADSTTLFILSGIAIFILLLAMVNFINLSTALSFRRAKEVGVRKVLGSSRKSLVFQFLAETAMLAFFSIALAIVFVKPVMNGFSSFLPEGVRFDLVRPSTILALFVLGVLTTLASGIYPAKILSGYLPVVILKGRTGAKGNQKWIFGKGLIIFQFTVSLIFIIGSIVILSQLKYAREKDTGFTAANIITIETKDRFRINILAQEIRQLPGIANVALQWVSPMTDNTRAMQLKLNNADVKEFEVTQVAGNENFIPLYQMKLLAGRNLHRSDSVTEFVINEKLSRFIGSKNPAQSIGRILYWNNRPYPVVGVVADFHTKSLHDPVTALCIINRVERMGALAVKFAGEKDQITQLISRIGMAWNKIYPETSFQYRFYDESLSSLYKKDYQTATLINMAMLVSIFISCMGLFGLSLHNAQRRGKEISIRKVLGATPATIAVMLSREFIVLILVSLAVASPIAGYFLHEWLSGFAYHISIQWWMFALAGMFVLGIAMFTTGYHLLKAAIVNPINKLRSE